MCRRRPQQYCGETSGHAVAAQKWNGHHLPLQNKKSERGLPPRRYFGSRGWARQLHYGGYGEARRRCD